MNTYVNRIGVWQVIGTHGPSGIEINTFVRLGDGYDPASDGLCRPYPSFDSWRIWSIYCHSALSKINLCLNYSNILIIHIYNDKFKYDPQVQHYLPKILLHPHSKHLHISLLIKLIRTRIISSPKRWAKLQHPQDPLMQPTNLKIHDRNDPKTIKAIPPNR